MPNIDSFLNMINLALSFIEMKASINKNRKNQIDFYNQKNNVVYSTYLVRSKNDILSDAIHADNLTFTFLLEGNVRVKLELYDSRIYEASVNLCVDYGNNCKKTVRIVKQGSRFTDIDIKIDGQDDYPMKELHVSSDHNDCEMFSCELGDEYDFENDYINGIRRRVAFNRNLKNKTFIGEVDEGCRDICNSLYLSSIKKDSGETFIMQTSIGKAIQRTTCEDAGGLCYMHQLLSHPRTKETMDYVLKEVEIAFPGIVDFIKSNFSIYTVRNMHAGLDENFMNFYQSIIIKECALASSEKTN